MFYLLCLIRTKQQSVKRKTHCFTGDFLCEIVPWSEIKCLKCIFHNIIDICNYTLITKNPAIPFSTASCISPHIFRFFQRSNIVVYTVFLFFCGCNNNFASAGQSQARECYLSILSSNSLQENQHVLFPKHQTFSLKLMECEINP